MEFSEKEIEKVSLTSSLDSNASSSLDSHEYPSDPLFYQSNFSVVLIMLKEMLTCTVEMVLTVKDPINNQTVLLVHSGGRHKPGEKIGGMSRNGLS
jgi:hypothetical protein